MAETINSLDDLGTSTVAPAVNLAPVHTQKLDAQGRAYATGKRKNAVARVWIKPGSGKIVVNTREVEVYFARPVLRMMIMTGRPHFYGKVDHKDFNYYIYDPRAGDWVGKGRKPDGMCYGNSFYTLTHCATPKGTVVWTARGQLFRLNGKARKWEERWRYVLPG